MAGLAYSGNCVRHINEVKLRRAGLVLGLVTTFDDYAIPGIHSDHSGPLSLAIPPWVGAMSTGDGFVPHLGRNGAYEVTTLSLLYKPAYK